MSETIRLIYETVERVGDYTIQRRVELEIPGERVPHGPAAAVDVLQPYVNFAMDAALSGRSPDRGTQTEE